MVEPKLIAMNERILGHISGTPCRFCRGRSHHNQLGTGENLGSRSPNVLSNPVLIITSFHILKVAKGIHK